MAYHASAVTNFAGGTFGSSLVSTMPATNVGDYVAAFLTCDFSSAVTFGRPSGWSQVNQRVVSTVDGQCVTMFELTGGAPASPPATYTWTTPQSGSDHQMVIMSFSGRSLSRTFLTGTSGNASTPVSAAMAGGSAAAGDDIIVAIGLDKTGGTDTWSFAAATGSPGTFTLRQNTDTSGLFTGWGISTLDNTSAGATGTLTSVITETHGSGQTGYTGWVISLAKSVAGAGSISGSSAIQITCSGKLVTDIVGSSAIAFTNTATLAGKVSAAGTNSITFSGSASRLVSSIAGASAINNATTGLLIGSGRCAGSISISALSTGSIVFDVIGSSLITFSESGTLQGHSNLSGTTPAVVSESGTLHGNGSLTGSSTLLVTQGGTLKGSGSLTSNTAILISSTAGIKGQSALSGLSAIQFTLSLSVGGLTDIVGSTTVVIFVSGTAKAAGKLTGATTNTISEVGTLVGKAAIEGTNSIAVNDVGLLAGQARADGSTNIVITESGVLAGLGSISVFVGINFSVVGSLIDTTTANATLTVTALGTAHATGILQAITRLAFITSLVNQQENSNFVIVVRELTFTAPETVQQPVDLDFVTVVSERNAA